jgi:SET domain-containing protein
MPVYTMLYLKKSTLPNAGLGLFTDQPFKKGDTIIEYLGEIITWPEALKRDEKGKGGYVFHITNKHCIDAYPQENSLGKYANDARGFSKIKGLKNNSEYETRKKQAFIIATRDIQAGEEIFVWYGADYWKNLKKPEELKDKK